MRKYLFIVLFLISYLSAFAQQHSDNIELFMHTRNTNGKTAAFLVGVNEDKPIWNPFTLLIETENYQNPASLVIQGDYTSNSKGWHTDRPEIVYSGNPCLQWTYQYNICVGGKTTKLKVKTLGYDGWDVYVMYDYSADKYYLWDPYHHQDISEIDTSTTLIMRNNLSNLQPTKPRNFRCTNPTGYGQNPVFNWNEPVHQADTSFSYQIYRNTGSGYNQIGSTSSTTYTDTGAELDKFGNTTYYYVKAKCSNSPLSDASNIVSINTDIVSKPLPDIRPDNKDVSNQTNAKNLSSLFIYPNPCNPTTQILYSITEKTQVQLAIFNIAGQQIANLVDEYQYQGEYSVNFNGQSLAGGIYLVRLLTKDRQVTQKILLLK